MSYPCYLQSIQSNIIYLSIAITTAIILETRKPTSRYRLPTTLIPLLIPIKGYINRVANIGTLILYLHINKNNYAI